MKKLIVLMLLIGFFATASAQNPLKGFFKATVDKDLFIDSHSLKALKTAPTILIRPVVDISFIEVTKSIIPGETLSTKAMQRGGFGVSVAFFKGIENTFSVNALALMPLKYDGTTQFNVSPALAIQGLKILSLGVGRDTEAKRWFGLLGISYNFSTVK